MGEEGTLAKEPQFYYFIDDNKEFERTLPNMIHKEGTEDMAKVDGDDVADEFRYAMMGAPLKGQNVEDILQMYSDRPRKKIKHYWYYYQRCITSPNFPTGKSKSLPRSSVRWYNTIRR